MQRFVSVREASAHYGLSETEVRRRIADGRLVAERLTRPQGTLLRVMIDAPDDQPTPANDVPTTHQDAPPRADSERLAGVVDGILQAKAQTEVWLIQEVGALRQRLGRTEAERDNALARTEELAAGVDHYRREYAWLKEQYEQERRRSWWRRLLGLT